ELTLPALWLTLACDRRVCWSLLIAFLVTGRLHALCSELEVVGQRTANHAGWVCGRGLVAKHRNLRVPFTRTNRAFTKIDCGNCTLTDNVHPVLGSRSGTGRAHVRGLPDADAGQFAEFIALEQTRSIGVGVLGYVDKAASRRIRNQVVDYIRVSKRQEVSAL